MTMRVTVLGWTVCALLIAPTCATAADSRAPARTAYLRYCSACHGESGKGDGVVSGAMTPRPTDLTKLAKENNGHLPEGNLMQAIDGRKSIRAHGDPAMPVWGEIFKAEVGRSMAEEAEVRGKLLLIVEYLGSIQEK